MAEPTRLHAAYRDRMARLRQATVALVLAQDAPSTPEFVAAVVPVVLDGQRAAVATTDAFMSLEAGLATDTSTAPLGLDADRLIGRSARRGTLLEDVYGRNHLAEVGTLASRMGREVNTDLTLAQRSAAWMHTEGDPRVAGWRRVTSGSACPLCAAAATRTYGRGDLQPIHDHCSCTVAAIYEPGRPPAPRDLEPLYAQASTASTDLRRIAATPTSPAVDIVDQGDLGPTLVAA